METRSDEKKMIKMLIRHWQIAGLTRPDTETFTDHNLACSLQSVVNPFRIKNFDLNKQEFSAGFFFCFLISFTNLFFRREPYFVTSGNSV